MNLTSLVPLGAALIALWFAVLLLRQYAGRKRLYQLWWAISMLSYAFASFGEFYALAYGWNVPMYKFYYFNAVSLVAVMAAGEMYMLFKNRVGHVYLVLMLLTMAAFLVLLVQVTPDANMLLQHDAAIGGNALEKGSLIRSVFPPVLSGVGGMILILGPLYSWWRSRYTPNLFIALGALLLSAAGRLAVLGYPEWLPIAELIGIAIIYYGVARGNGVKRQEVTV
ncbi:MAG: hypothetical protein ACXVDE_00845 [Tumebacillaceae bacterium]